MPFTASTTIFGQRSNCMNGRRSKPSVSRSSWPPSCWPPISPPTQKTSPRAVTRRTSIPESRSASTAAFLRPWYISMVRALRRAGRSMTTRRTPSAEVARRWRDPRSIRRPRATPQPTPAAGPPLTSSICGRAPPIRGSTVPPASSAARSFAIRSLSRSTATPQATAGKAASFSAPSRSMRAAPGWPEQSLWYPTATWISATRRFHRSSPSTSSSSSSKRSWASKNSPALKRRTAAPKPVGNRGSPMPCVLELQRQSHAGLRPSLRQRAEPPGREDGILARRIDEVALHDVDADVVAHDVLEHPERLHHVVVRRVDRHPEHGQHAATAIKAERREARDRLPVAHLVTERRRGRRDTDDRRQVEGADETGPGTRPSCRVRDRGVDLRLAARIVHQVVPEELAAEEDRALLVERTYPRRPVERDHALPHVLLGDPGDGRHVENRHPPEVEERDAEVVDGLGPEHSLGVGLVGIVGR